MKKWSQNFTNFWTRLSSNFPARGFARMLVEVNVLLGFLQFNYRFGLDFVKGATSNPQFRKTPFLLRRLPCHRK
jgi:hypothetical protein